MRCARCVGIDADGAMTTWVGCENLQACALRVDQRWRARASGMDGGDPAAEPPAATARSLAPTHAHSCRQADAASGSGEKGATCGNGLRGLQVSGALQAFGCAVLWDVCFCCAVLRVGGDVDVDVAQLLAGLLLS